MHSTEKTEASNVSVLKQLGDELQLQIWLAGAEIRHPSAHLSEVLGDARGLAGIRDELRVQRHLGRLEATQGLERLEERWHKFKELGARTSDDAQEGIRVVLRQIREGYAEIMQPRV